MDYFSTCKTTTPWCRNTHTHSPIQNKDALTKATMSYVVLKRTNIRTPTTTIYYIVAVGMIKKMTFIGLKTKTTFKGSKKPRKSVYKETDHRHFWTKGLTNQLGKKKSNKTLSFYRMSRKKPIR